MDSLTGRQLGGDGTGPKWSLRLFGKFELSPRGGESLPSPGRRERALLAYLASQPDCRESRRNLAALLWGDTADETLLDNLRVCVWGLRKALHDTEHRIVISQDDDIALNADAFEVDVRSFRQLAKQSETAALDRAAALYGGEFLEGLSLDSEPFQSWVRDEAGRLREVAIGVLRHLGTHLAESGESERAIAALQRILKLDPLHEPAVRQLMRLYAGSGRRGLAHELYRSLAETLKSDLNAKPELETRRLLEEISRGDSKPHGSAPIADPDIGRMRPVSTATEKLAQVPPIARRKRPMLVRTAIGALAIGALLAAGLFLQIGRTPEAGPATPTSLALPEKPSIAVLPFEGLSNDSKEVELADALTNDITTALSIVSDMFVIDRLSTADLKQVPGRATEAAAELGVRYVLEGGVQRSADRVRVSMRLVDGMTGGQLWAERYDREIAGTFALQDEITLAVLTALQVRLTEGEQERMAAVHGTRNLDAWLVAGQALKAIRRLSEEDTMRGRELYRQAVTLDPNYAGAVDGLAWTHLLAVRFGWSEMPAADLAMAAELGEKALALDPMRSRSYALLGAVRLLMNDHVQAVNYGERAIALDPNGSEVAALLALTLTYTNDVARSPDLLVRAMRLSPYYPDWYRWAMGRAQRLLGNFDEAEAVLTQGVDTNTFSMPHRVELAATLAEQGKLNEAQVIARDVLRLAPSFTVLGWISNPSHQDVAVMEREQAALRRAGLP